MTLRETFLELAPRIELVSEGRAFFELRLLAAHLLGKSSENIVAMMGDPVTEDFKVTLSGLVDRRCLGETIAYIVGKREFFEYSFVCGPGVLVPRPETEVLVEWILEDTRDNLSLHDLCTGTGCIPISILSRRKHWSVSASDISSLALDYAHKNNASLGSAVKLVHSDLFDNEFFMSKTFDIISANPPYVPRAEVNEKLESGWIEPSLALDGGPLGVECIESLAREAKKHLSKGGYLYLEFGDGQVELIKKVLVELQYTDIEIRTDLQGLPRIVRALYSSNEF